MVDDFSKYASKRFYKLDDVQDRPRRETIAGCSEGQYGKPVLTFKSGRRFSLNATNIDIMREAFGDESNDCVGHEVELYAGEIKYNGDVRSTVLIRPILPSPRPAERSKPVLVAQPQPQPKPKLEANERPTDEMNDQIPF
jgi:hypothetical protein